MVLQSPVRAERVRENADVREAENEKRKQSDEQNVENRTVSAKEAFVFAARDTNEDRRGFVPEQIARTGTGGAEVDRRRVVGRIN